MKIWIIFLSSILLLFSCGNDNQVRIDPYKIVDIYLYDSCQVVEKNSTIQFGSSTKYYFKFRKDNNITKRIYVIKYDWERYDVGEYIKKK